MNNHSHQADGRTVAQVLLRPFQWWAKHPWAVFWGSVVLFPCFFLPVAIQLPHEAGTWIVWVGILLLLGGTLGYGWGVVSGLLDKRTPVWKRVLKGVALTAIPVLLAVIVITIHAVDRKERTYRVLSDTKTAMTQALLYGRDTGHYPTSLQVLREAGYLNTLDKDPWGRDYVLAPILTRGAPPTAGDDVYLYSRGSQGTGTYPRPFTPITGAGGSSGYSSIYGVWREQ